jgi:manganese efflux pump family protein
MDAVAVCVSSGIARGRASWPEAFRMAGVFGLFQAVMPAIGFVGGALLGSLVEAYDHWIAFTLLAIVGGHMILESRRGPDEKPASNPFAWGPLLLLGVATSIDALAVGFTLSLIDIPPAIAIAVIGLTTFVLCLPAVRLGAKLGSRFTQRAEFAGGAVLIAIGVRILIEHLSGAA